MTPETIAALVNFGMGGAVIAVTIVFLKYMEKQSAVQKERDDTARESYDHRDQLWKEFFSKLIDSNGMQSETINKNLMELTRVISVLSDEVKSMRGDIYNHDIRVDAIVRKIDHPNVEPASSTLPSRRKKVIE